MRKQIITTAIESFIDGGADINTAEKFRDLETKIGESLFPVNLAYETQDAGVYTIPAVNGYDTEFALTLTKIGKRVFVDGTIANNEVFPLSGTSFVLFPLLALGLNNDFLPDDIEDPVTGNPLIYRGIAYAANEAYVRILVQRLTIDDIDYGLLRISGTMQAKGSLSEASKKYFLHGVSYNAKY